MTMKAKLLTKSTGSIELVGYRKRSGGDRKIPAQRSVTASRRIGDMFATAYTETIPLRAETLQFHHDRENSRVKPMMEAIKRGEELPPILVAAKKNGTYYVLDGSHRAQAALKAGKTEIEAYVVSWKDLVAVCEAHFDGRLPVELSELDDYILLDEDGDEPYSKRASKMAKEQVNGIPTFDQYVKAKGGFDAVVSDLFQGFFPRKDQATEESVRERYGKVVQRLTDALSFPLRVYRAVSLPEGIEDLNHDKLGVFWTWDARCATPHWGAENAMDAWTVIGEVVPGAIDWVGTVRANLDVEFGEFEKEVRLKEGAQIKLIGYEPGATSPYPVLGPESEHFVAPAQASVTASKTAKEQEIDGASTNEDGYWAGDGNAASGILAIARDTKRLCLAWRNAETHTGDCWGTIGGAVQKGKSPEDSAKAEMAEEVGYAGSIEMHPGWVFTDGGFSYHNFVGVVDGEFSFAPASAHAWETDAIHWASLPDILEDMEAHPGEYHPEFINFFKHSRELIEKLVGGPETAKTAAGSTYSPLYHGTRNQFDTFKTDRTDEGFQSSMGAYFTDSLQAAKQFAGRKGFVKTVQIILRKPLDLRSIGEDTERLPELLPWLDEQGKRLCTHVGATSMFSMLETLDSRHDLVPELQHRGYDGIIFVDDLEGTTYVVFDAKQIEVSHTDPVGKTAGGEEEAEDEFGSYPVRSGAVDVKGNWKRFKALPDSAYVLLFHATSRLNAEKIMRSGFRAEKALNGGDAGYTYLGSANGLGTYQGMAGSDSVLMMAKVRKGDLEPDLGGDWKEFLRRHRKDLALYGTDLKEITAADTFATINQVRAKNDLVEPVGIVGDDTKTASPVAVDGNGYARFTPHYNSEKAPAKMYHSSPARLRKKIQAQGLVVKQPRGAGRGNSPGVYGLGDPRDFYDLHETDTEPFDPMNPDANKKGVWYTSKYEDIWEFDTKGLIVRRDEASGLEGSWYSKTDVPAASLRLYREGQVLPPKKKASEEDLSAIELHHVKTASPDMGYRSFNNRDEDLKKVKFTTKGHKWFYTIEAKFEGKVVGKMPVKVEHGIAAIAVYPEVLPEWRGTGLGQTLYDKAIQHAAKLGVSTFQSDDSNFRSDDAESAWKRLKRRYNVVQPGGEEDRYVIHLAPFRDKKTAAMPPEAFEEWVGVDLDGTLAYSLDDYSDPLKIGEPIPAMVRKVKALLLAGYTVKVMTARMADKEQAEAIGNVIGDWTENVVGQRLGATNEKTPGMLMQLDDKARQVVENTGEVAKAARKLAAAKTAAITPADRTLYHGTKKKKEFTTLRPGVGTGDPFLWLGELSTARDLYTQTGYDKGRKRVYEVKLKPETRLANMTDRKDELRKAFLYYLKVVDKQHEAEDLDNFQGFALVHRHEKWFKKAMKMYKYDGLIVNDRARASDGPLAGKTTQHHSVALLNQDKIETQEEMGEEAKTAAMKAARKLAAGKRKELPVGLQDLVSYLTMNHRQRLETFAETFMEDWFEWQDGSDDQDAVSNTSEADEADLDHFYEMNHRLMEYEQPENCPAYMFMEYVRTVRGGWVAHFTNHAEAIVREGFTRGVPDPNRIALTTQMDEDEKSEGGYCFGFPVNNQAGMAFVDRISDRPGYGNQVVFTKVDAVIVKHYTDGYDQAVFWGVDAQRRVAVVPAGTGWAVLGSSGTERTEVPTLGQALQAIKGAGVKQDRRAENTGEVAKAASPDFGYNQYNDEEADLGEMKFRCFYDPDSSFEVGSYLYDRRQGYISCVQEDWEGENSACVAWVEIEKKWKGTGLGQILYDKAIQAAKRKGFVWFISDETLSQEAISAWARLKARYPVEEREGGATISDPDDESEEGPKTKRYAIRLKKSPTPLKPKKAMPDFGYTTFKNRDAELRNVVFEVGDQGGGTFQVDARHEKILIGYIYCGMQSHMRGGPGEDCVVTNVNLMDKTWRGTGLGQMLYDKAIEEAIERGADRFYSDSQMSQDAQSAWRRLKQRYPVENENGGVDIWNGPNDVDEDAADRLYIDLDEVAESKVAGSKTAKRQVDPTPEIFDKLRQVRSESRADSGIDFGMCYDVSEYAFNKYGWEMESGFYLRDLKHPEVHKNGPNAPHGDHGWNKLNDGTIIDLTHDQFGPPDILVLKPGAPGREHYHAYCGSYDCSICTCEHCNESFAQEAREARKTAEEYPTKALDPKTADLDKNTPGKPETQYEEGSNGWALFPDQRGEAESVDLKKMVQGKARLLQRHALASHASEADTQHMDTTLTESVLASFDSDAQITWDLASPKEALARFQVEEITVEVSFRQEGEGWDVAFTTSEPSTTLAFRIFAGVFQAVKEFLSIREPEQLRFSSKDVSLGRLYENYLGRNNTELRELGYTMAEPARSNPLTSFLIVKATPSAWKN